MTSTETFNLRVEAGTRNHKGSFIKDTSYYFVGIEQAGWALICQDSATCHYVDPDCLLDFSSKHSS